MDFLVPLTETHPVMWTVGTTALPGDGWPLFFRGYDPAVDEESAVWWYAPDVVESPVYLADPLWGPAWSPDGQEVLFAYTEELEDGELTTTVYSFPILPVFWP